MTDPDFPGFLYPQLLAPQAGGKRGHDAPVSHDLTSATRLGADLTVTNAVEAVRLLGERVSPTR